MSRFFNVDRGCVNLDHVAVAREYEMPARSYPSAPPGRGLRFEAADGRTLGEISYGGDLDLATATAPVVPAAPDAVAVWVGAYYTDERPTVADIYVYKRPVLAWRITQDGALPVFHEEPTGGTVVLFPLQCGGLLDPENCVYHDIEDAKATALRDAQSAWDQRHAGGSSETGAEPSNYCAFGQARQALFGAFREWLKEEPAPQDAADEIEGTASVMRQMVALRAAE